MTETTIARRAPRSLLAFLREGRGGHSGAKKQRWTVKRVIALVMMLLIPVIGVVGGASAANANPDPAKYPFYNLASSTTAFFSTVNQPGSDGDFGTEWENVLDDPGSAGSLLGYADRSLSESGGWLFSALSGSSDAIGYEALQVRAEEGGTGAADNSKVQGLADYAYFGAALKGMGLDGMSTGLSLGMLNWVTGGLVMVLYLVSGMVDTVFNSFVDMLALLNPFKLFYLGVEAVNPTFAEGMVGGNSYVGPLSGVAEFIGQWYGVLNAVAWEAMVPIFIAVLLFSLIMFKKMDRGGALKKLVVRLVFIGLGLPLMGSMYTGMIDSMSDASTEGNSASTRVVMSTYVDFEKWVMANRLALPGEAVVEWDPEGGQPTGKAQAKVRNTALAINNKTYGLTLTPMASTGDFDASWSSQIMEGRADEAGTEATTFDLTVDMLSRYMNGAQMSAASFETAAQGNLAASKEYKDDKGAKADTWFTNLQQDATALKALKGDDAPDNNPLISVKNGTGLRAQDSSGDRQFTSNTSSCATTGAQIATTDGAKVRSCNLSPLAMYNYLNTDFGANSMTMYSSKNVMSEATRSIHNSVSQVGTGAMSVLYWFNAVVLLGAFVFIGLGYAFSLVFSSMRRSFQIITAVPFATLGALAAIAKVVVYSIALVLEVVITIFVYQFVQKFLTSLPQIIEMPFGAVLSGSAGLSGFMSFLTDSWGFSMMVTLLSIIGVVAFTVMALRLRKTLVKAVEEAVTKLVEKFMDTQVGMPGGGGGVAPALAGGLASGAGAAAANRMMSGGGKGAKGNALSGGAGNGGAPAAVETASGTSAGDGAGAQGELTDGGQPAVTTGAEGNGDPGSPVGAPEAGGADGGSVADEVAMGRKVETEGLTKPDEAPAPRVGDDAMSAASESADQSAKGYQAADASRVAAATEGAQAVGHGATAVAKASAGDAAGAAKSGGRAVEHAGASAAARQDAKQKEADAGSSSLDAPGNKHAEKAAKARAVSRVGGSVANTAGSVNATSGGTGGKPQGAPATTKSVPAKQVQSQAGPKKVTAPKPQKAPQPQRQAAEQPSPKKISKPQRPAVKNQDK
ncbi:MAG: hypothetical protein ABWX92_09130 [Mycetocola sp.]